MTEITTNDANGPFEGPEKLLEIWFAQSPAHVPDASFPDVHGRTGLRKVPRQTWEDMLSIVRCKVLSVVNGDDIDAYLLSESSLFVSPHRLILKTCGTTLNLLGLPRILEIAATEAEMPSVYRCFYSRKSFMFPDRQEGPHKDWNMEVQYLDNIFPNGAAYTVGRVNGDHWLLYLTSPAGESGGDSPDSPISPSEGSANNQDFTIEILMSDLAPESREPFFSASDEGDPTEQGLSLSSSLGITEIFPPSATTLDAYSFSPCGYSANAIIRGKSGKADRINGQTLSFGEGYYTIHVTPEEGWSYASFECNVPVPTSGCSAPDVMPDLKTLIQRVVDIFKPGRLSLTMFLSTTDDLYADVDHIEHAQNAFKAALVGCGEKNTTKRAYRRSDKINYEFRGYDLAFASFEAVQ